MVIAAVIVITVVEKAAPATIKLFKQLSSEASELLPLSSYLITSNHQNKLVRQVLPMICRYGQNISET